MNKKLIALSVSGALLLPLLALAFNPGTVPNQVSGTFSINTLVDVIFGIVWPVAVAFFIIMFLLAGFRFASARGKSDEIEGARQAVLWGVVGVVVALLAFSIPFIVRNTLGNGI